MTRIITRVVDFALSVFLCISSSGILRAETPRTVVHGGPAQSLMLANVGDLHGANVMVKKVVPSPTTPPEATSEMSTLHNSLVPPLADQINRNTLVYVGWSGLNAVRNHGQLPAQLRWADHHAGNILHKTLPFILNYIDSENPRMAKQLSGLWKIATDLRDYPTGFYFNGMICGEDGLPYPRLGFLSRIRGNASTVVKRLAFVSELGRNLNLPIRVERSGDIVRIILGDAPRLDKPLSDANAFKSLLSYRKDSPTIWVYVNVARLPEVIEQSASALPHFAAAAAEKWRASKALLGLEQVKGFLWSAGFEQGQWVSQADLLSPAPRSGVARLLNTRPIADALLRTVPATASTVGAFQVRPDVAIPSLEECLREADSTEASHLNQGSTLARAFLGADPREQLTKALGNQWVYYCDSDIGGDSLDGLVFANLLSDANQFKRWLGPVMQLLYPDPMSQRNSVYARRLETNGLSFWRVELPGSALVLSICDNYLIVSHRLGAVLAACDFIRKSGNPILDQDQFLAMRKRLDSTLAGAFWYSNLSQRTALPQMAWSAIDQLYRAATRLAPFRSSPLPFLPEHLIPHLSPAGIFVWTDAHGWHLVSSSPFPGAAVLAGPLVLLAPPTLVAEPITDAIHSSRHLRQRRVATAR